MKISFIIPAYNAEKYIIRCLDSIISQCTENYEIIVVNDGSTDNTLATVQKYTASNNNNIIILIDKKNQGVSAARNDALDIATGEVIMFLDADDYLIDSSLKFVRWNETADLVIFGMNRRSKSGVLTEWKHEARTYYGGGNCLIW